jgi:hypothetical protein
MTSAGVLTASVAGESLPEFVGDPGRPRQVIRGVGLLQPPSGPNAVGSLAADDVAQGEADRPLATAGIGIPGGVWQGRE